MSLHQQPRASERIARASERSVGSDGPRGGGGAAPLRQAGLSAVSWGGSKHGGPSLDPPVSGFISRGGPTGAGTTSNGFTPAQPAGWQPAQPRNGPLSGPVTEPPSVAGGVGLAPQSHRRDKHMGGLQSLAMPGQQKLSQHGGPVPNSHHGNSWNYGAPGGDGAPQVASLRHPQQLQAHAAHAAHQYGQQAQQYPQAPTYCAPPPQLHQQQQATHQRRGPPGAAGRVNAPSGGGPFTVEVDVAHIFQAEPARPGDKAARRLQADLDCEIEELDRQWHLAEAQRFRGEHFRLENEHQQCGSELQRLHAKIADLERNKGDLDAQIERHEVEAAACGQRCANMRRRLGESTAIGQ